MWWNLVTIFLPFLLIAVSQSGHIFKIELSEIDSLVNSNQLSQLSSILSSQGSLAVTSLPKDYSQAVRNIKRSAPACLEQLNYPQFYLPDGSQRRTFASASDEHEDYPDCIREDSETVAKHLDTVDVLISRLITDIAGPENLVWKTQNDQKMRNFSTALFKEHIHVYKPVEGLNDDSGYAAPFHTDNGLLLMITPFQEHPLQMKNKMGEIVETGEIGEDAVLILLASALPQWLLKGTESSSKFFPVPHAVPSLVNDVSSRTVFARMKVVPMDAYPSNLAAEEKKDRNLFEQFFNNVKQAGSEELCPIEKPAHHQLALESSWSALKTEECSHSQAYCWMNCLELPTTCPQSPVQCSNSDSKPCCTDTVTEDCEAMDQSCHWECQASNDTTEDKFCNGYGTDMYMQGFTASGNGKDACVILLFKSWVLDTRTKFGLGCVGVILLGVAVEGMLCLRRQLQGRRILLRISGVTRRVSIVLLFGLNIASGYLAMLVAMTYSVELFICMVIGLVVGHAIFNTEAAVGESVDPCCASQAIAHTNDAKQHEAENMSA